MLKQIGLGLLFIVVIGVTGLAMGWATAPRYLPPAEDGEGRLRQRAERFYHAQQTMDFRTMSQIYTPARQMENAEEYSAMAEDRASLFLRMKPETRAEMMASIATIHAADLDVKLEGDWAVTMGSRSIFDGDREIEVALDTMVWVRDHGDWWAYNMENCEIIAYGNPPEFARKQLERSKRKSMVNITDMQMSGPDGMEMQVDGGGTP